jgi:hypothetical protein
METIGNILVEVLKFLNLWFTNSRTQIQKVVNIYDAMHDILDTTSTQRVMIFKAHNGGGIIKPSGELYSSCLYEDYIDPFHSQKAKYQKIELDGIYLKMLLETMQDGYVHLKTSEMKDGLLKGIYQSEGVTESRIYYLGRTKKYVFYCSLANSKEWLMDQAEKSKLDMGVSKIKQNIL